MFKYLHVMVDLETAGIGPTARILSLGACCINIPTDTFYRRIVFDDHGPFEVDPETLMWWNKQDPAVYREAFEGVTPMHEALNDFVKWFPSDAYIWAKGIDFDLPVLKYALKFFGYPQPWHYRRVLCMRTLGQISRFQWTKDHPNAHNALADAQHQAAQVRELLQLNPQWGL